VKITWPAEWDHTSQNYDASAIPVFLASVDGVHCNINEPTHPQHSKNPDYYSHKTNQSALAYELAMSVYEQRLVWMRGPFPAGVPDINIFRGTNLVGTSLVDLIPPGKRAIGDKGYRGEREAVSTPSSHDTPAVRQFKGRVRSRQETFNARVKVFKCVAEQFRHGEEKHKVCFEAICVICQYQLELGSPLFDV